jgi:kinetochore protein Mis13/DSN1
VCTRLGKSLANAASGGYGLDASDEEAKPAERKEPIYFGRARGRNQTVRPSFIQRVPSTDFRSLEEEKSAWESLVSSSKEAAPPPETQAPTFGLADIDPSLLDPTQAPILAALRQSTEQDHPHAKSSTSQPSAFTFTTTTALQTHLTKLSLSLEPNIDLFTDGVHKIEQYRNTADRVADRVLGTAAKRLDERDREIKERAGADGIGVGDILRGLAGVLGES